MELIQSKERIIFEEVFCCNNSTDISLFQEEGNSLQSEILCIVALIGKILVINKYIIIIFS